MQKKRKSWITGTRRVRAASQRQWSTQGPTPFAQAQSAGAWSPVQIGAPKSMPLSMLSWFCDLSQNPSEDASAGNLPL